jgi:O-antigen ligase
MILFAYLALVPKGSTQLIKALLVAAMVAGSVLVSPIGERVIDNLPFVGTVSAETVNYRERLAHMSWDLIQQNPFFGDPFYLSNLEQLRQGQGIIDLVNTYAAVTMHSGLVGLCLFVGPFILGMWNTYRSVNRSAGPDQEVSLLGASLLACMLGTLLMLATASFILGIAIMYWVLVGLAAGYHRLGRPEETAQTPRSYATGPYSRWQWKR